jgi:hypothetical protein
MVIGRLKQIRSQTKSQDMKTKLNSAKSWLDITKIYSANMSDKTEEVISFLEISWFESWTESLK